MIDAIKNIASLSMTSGIGAVTDNHSVSMTSRPGAIATPGTVTGASAGESFASVLGAMASGAADSLKHAETASFAGMKGTMSTREVVDAVMQADQSLQTVMAVRDKVVSAFLDITKMQI
jgi:flagellar hook-basal body complex protein FliE